LNPGPLAPQFGAVNHLGTLFTENTRLSTPCVGPSLVPVDESFGFSTHLGPSLLRNSQRNGGGTPRASRTRAVVSAPRLFAPFCETGDEDKSFPYTCETPPPVQRLVANTTTAGWGRSASSCSPIIYRSPMLRVPPQDRRENSKQRPGAARSHGNRDPQGDKASPRRNLLSCLNSSSARAEGEPLSPTSESWNT
jgi:hypothetical protein